MSTHYCDECPNCNGSGATTVGREDFPCVVCKGAGTTDAKTFGSKSIMRRAAVQNPEGMVELQVKLEAENAELREKLKDWEGSAKTAAAGGHGNEKHCTCVGGLRVLLKEAKEKLAASQRETQWAVKARDAAEARAEKAELHAVDMRDLEAESNARAAAGDALLRKMLPMLLDAVGAREMIHAHLAPPAAGEVKPCQHCRGSGGNPADVCPICEGSGTGGEVPSA